MFDDRWSTRSHKFSLILPFLRINVKLSISSFLSIYNPLNLDYSFTLAMFDSSSVIQLNLSIPVPIRLTFSFTSLTKCRTSTDQTLGTSPWDTRWTLVFWTAFWFQGALLRNQVICRSSEVILYLSGIHLFRQRLRFVLLFRTAASSSSTSFVPTRHSPWFAIASLPLTICSQTLSSKRCASLDDSISRL